MSFKLTLLAAATLVCAGLSAAAVAATSPATATFTVTATVLKSCTVTTGNIGFGNYDPTATAALVATGAVNAKCTKGSVVAVALNEGANKAAASTPAVPARQMIGGTGADLLPYHIYTAAAGTTEWGNTAAQEPATQTSVSVNTAMVFPTNGSLPALADVPSGAYTDTVTATLTF
jgi:spore coat protein U-like protein